MQSAGCSLSAFYYITLRPQLTSWLEPTMMECVHPYSSHQRLYWKKPFNRRGRRESAEDRRETTMLVLCDPLRILSVLGG